MPKNADNVLFYPGDLPSVTVRANSAGEVAMRGDLVKVVAENAQHAIVEKVEAAGEGHAQLAGDPSNYDPASQTLAAGDIAGTADCAVYSVIAIYPAADDFDPSTSSTTEDSSVGAPVHFGPNGVIAYSSANDSGLGPNGYVWQTAPTGFDRAGTVAVAKTR